MEKYTHEKAPQRSSLIMWCTRLTFTDTCSIWVVGTWVLDCREVPAFSATYGLFPALGGEMNVIHIASMPNTLVFTAFAPLRTTHCARMWNRTRCHKRPCQLRRCPKRWYMPRFCLVVQHTAQGCGAGHVVTSVHANCDDAQITGIYRVFASLYNILRKDVEQEKLSQASMPLAEVRSHLKPKPQFSKNRSSLN